ncbi:DUF1559 domain-containing protein, partial [Mariniblastus sp.]|nr:DUF1559 domain-containing protein [Mariniblastus sp.]
MNQPYKSPVINDGGGSTGTSGKAIASLILGFLSIVGMCFTGIPGVILGIMGLGDINRSRGQVGGKAVAIFGIILSSLGIVWTIIVLLIGMLLPAVQAVREAARRTTCMNNMKQQSLAMLNYESAHQEFPLRDKNGLSWRVQILPFIEHGNLYDRFNHDEPWDSDHNIQLLAEMPPVFECPSLELEPGFTIYQVPYTDIANNPAAEDSALFDTSGRPITFRQLSDGSSNTACILEVDPAAAVEWTKPADWEYDPSDPKRDLGNVHPGIIHVTMADGSCHAIPKDISPEELKA